jgi:hypothetical protein
MKEFTDHRWYKFVKNQSIQGHCTPLGWNSLFIQRNNDANESHVFGEKTRTIDAFTTVHSRTRSLYMGMNTTFFPVATLPWL